MVDSIDIIGRHRYLRRLRRWADHQLPPDDPERDALAWAVATALVAARGGQVDGPPTAHPIDLPSPPPESDPCLAGDAWAVLRTAARARRAGAYHTPPDVARRVVDLALARREDIPATVWDPAVGGGAFLVAAADALVEAGLEPDDALGRLRGTDLDPTAVRLARAALSQWAADAGAAGTPQLEEGDAFAAETWDVDLVVGNPPFLGQLRAATSRTAAERAAATRLLGARAGYADAAGLFLALAVERLAPGGVAALVQPQSLLAARDSGAIRERVTTHAALEGLWVVDELLFAASVHTCVPVVRAGRGRAATTTLHTGRAGLEAAVAPCPSGDAPWSGLVAEARGVPHPFGGGPRTLGDIADVTADFRDAFYEVAAAVREAPGGAAASTNGASPVVSVGLIDANECLWGRRPARIAGRRWNRPVADVDELGSWARRRRVPKVLVATQTKVVEAVADIEGSLLPLTPVISVVPEPSGCWRVLAALLDPWATAWLMRRAAGAARSPDRLKVSAGLLRMLPVPDDSESWDAAAECLAHDGPGGVDRAATLMLRARGVGQDEVEPLLAWWSARR